MRWKSYQADGTAGESAQVAQPSRWNRMQTMCRLVDFWGLVAQWQFWMRTVTSTYDFEPRYRKNASMPYFQNLKLKEMIKLTPERVYQQSPDEWSRRAEISCSFYYFNDRVISSTLFMIKSSSILKEIDMKSELSFAGSFGNLNSLQSAVK